MYVVSENYDKRYITLPKIFRIFLIYFTFISLISPIFIILIISTNFAYKDIHILGLLYSIVVFYAIFNSTIAKNIVKANYKININDKIIYYPYLITLSLEYLTILFIYILGNFHTGFLLSFFDNTNVYYGCIIFLAISIPCAIKYCILQYLDNYTENKLINTPEEKLLIVKT